MYRLTVKSGFSSAHRLRGYKGKCEELHGHNWKVEAALYAERLDGAGLAMDFHKFKNILKKVLQELDHKYLNDLSYFKKVNPTSENLAEYIFGKMTKQINKGACRLQEVTVWESDNSSATYSEQ